VVSSSGYTGQRLSFPHFGTASARERHGSGIWSALGRSERYAADAYDGSSTVRNHAIHQAGFLGGRAKVGYHAFQSQDTQETRRQGRLVSLEKRTRGNGQDAWPPSPQSGWQSGWPLLGLPKLRSTYIHYPYASAANAATGARSWTSAAGDYDWASEPDPSNITNSNPAAVRTYNPGHQLAYTYRASSGSKPPPSQAQPAISPSPRTCRWRGPPRQPTGSNRGNRSFTHAGRLPPSSAITIHSGFNNKSRQAATSSSARRSRRPSIQQRARASITTTTTALPTSTDRRRPLP
jgi:hypothetical protein